MKTRRERQVARNALLVRRSVIGGTGSAAPTDVTTTTGTTDTNAATIDTDVDINAATMDTNATMMDTVVFGIDGNTLSLPLIPTCCLI